MLIECYNMNWTFIIFLTFGNISFSTSHSAVAYEMCTISIFLIHTFSAPEHKYKVVFESTRDEDLFTAANLKAMCSLADEKLPPAALSYHQCPAYSIGFFVGIVNDKPCLQINDDDVTEFLATLRQCQDEGYIETYCEVNCTVLQMKCLQFNAYYHVINHLADTDFIDGKSDKLKYALAFLSANTYDDLQYYEEHMENAKLSNDRVKVTGIHVGDTIDLFNKYLVEDMIYFIVANGLIFLVMLLYTKSFVLTVATSFNVAFSFGLTYFLYHVVFQIEYFPFMNLLTALILIAVAADDVFVFVDIWEHSLSEHSSYDLSERVHHTLYHAGTSVLVTSLTTSSAFFANLVSNITAIRCFGIFSGIAILTNFLLMITWIPAIIVGINVTTEYCCSNIKLHCVDQFLNRISNLSAIVFQKILPSIIIKAWHVCLMILFLVGIGGIIVVFYKPQLNLPSSEEFQLFDKNHPLELYNRVLKHKFLFVQKELEQEDGMVGYVFWGVTPADNGNHLNPESEGHLVMDNKFDITTPEAQEWMLNFCTHLKNSSFVGETTKQMPCSMQIFKDIMALPCGYVTHRPCCEQPVFPVPTELFNECYTRLIQYKNMCIGSYAVLGTPVFNEEDNVDVYRISFYTNMIWTAKFSEMEDLYKTMNNFMEAESDTAPKSVSSGFMYSEFDFYDLQQSLLVATFSSVGLSLAAVFVMMLFTTFNLLLTFFAILNIAFSIIVTVGILVLLGWELNILESVTISLAVGLSIDFSIHYGVAYRLSTNRQRIDRTCEAYAKVGSAVMMAAFTTFIAGACMLGCRILSYTQLGIFLMVVMAISWVFASFFFMSLCGKLGPQDTFAQIPMPCCNNSVKDELDSPRLDSPRLDNVKGIRNDSFVSSTRSLDRSLDT